MTTKSKHYLHPILSCLSVFSIAVVLVGCDDRQKVETIEFRNESPRVIHVDSVSGFQHIPPAGWLAEHSKAARMNTTIDGDCELKWGYRIEEEYPYPTEYFTYRCDLSTLPQTDLRRIVFTFGSDQEWSFSAWPKE